MALVDIDIVYIYRERERESAYKRWEENWETPVVIGATIGIPPHNLLFNNMLVNGTQYQETLNNSNQMLYYIILHWEYIWVWPL